MQSLMVWQQSLLQSHHSCGWLSRLFSVLQSLDLHQYLSEMHQVPMHDLEQFLEHALQNYLMAQFLQKLGPAFDPTHGSHSELALQSQQFFWQHQPPYLYKYAGQLSVMRLCHGAWPLAVRDPDFASLITNDFIHMIKQDNNSNKLSADEINLLQALWHKNIYDIDDLKIDGYFMTPQELFKNNGIKLNNRTIEIYKNILNKQDKPKINKKKRQHYTVDIKLPVDTITIDKSNERDVSKITTLNNDNNVEQLPKRRTAFLKACDLLNTNIQPNIPWTVNKLCKKIVFDNRWDTHDILLYKNKINKLYIQSFEDWDLFNNTDIKILVQWCPIDTTDNLINVLKINKIDNNNNNT